MRFKLLILILSLLEVTSIYSQFSPASINFPSTPSPEVIQSAESNPIPKIVPGADNILFEDTGIASGFGPEATIPNAISDVSGIAGADLTKVLGYLIEGNAITSTLGGNFIPFYNLVDGSIVGFDLDKNEKISVKQLLNSKFMNEFETTLSKGAKLRQFFKNSDLRFRN